MGVQVITRRQTITAAAYVFSTDRQRPTQSQLAQRWGITQAAVSRRLKRFVNSLNEDQRARYLACAANRRGRKRRTRVVQLSLMENL